MEKVLNQEQIDAMVQAARGGSGSGSPRGVNVIRWDARQAGQLGRQQLQAISALHEAFAGNLSHSVAAYLRVVFAAKLVSAEHLTYGEFLQRVPEVTYLATCRLMPADAAMLLQLDLTAAFPLIDVLLGGEGKGKSPDRALSAMEAQILETVVQIVCRELQTAWQLLALEFGFEQHQEAEQLQHLMALEEKTLSLSFEVTVGDQRGTLNLVFPAAVSNALLRKMTVDRVQVRRRNSAESGARMRSQLLEASFPTELSVQLAPSPVRDLMRLEPGMLLRLRTPVRNPASLRVGGLDLFTAAAARRDRARAAQILRRNPAVSERETDND